MIDGKQRVRLGAAECRIQYLKYGDSLWDSLVQYLEYLQILNLFRDKLIDWIVIMAYTHPMYLFSLIRVCDLCRPLEYLLRNVMLALSGGLALMI